VTVPDEVRTQFDDVLGSWGEPWYDLTLIVSGASERSVGAITYARELCDIHLSGRHHLSVVDLQTDLGFAVSGRVLATPTLVKNSPPPTRRCIGDLSHIDRVLLALGIPVADSALRMLG
jgi:circadian clock protein KaiB